MKQPKIRIAGVEKESITDGPGVRYTIFFQGCSHECPGCQNPQTWDEHGGTLVDIDEVVSDIVGNKLIDGVTLSGGEPMLQTAAAIKLLTAIREQSPKLDVWCFSGYTFEEIMNNKDKVNLLKLIDILVDGRFIKNESSLELLFRGSSNQRIIDVKKSLRFGRAIKIIQEQ